jgi:two-component system phosphate regulon response regulator PhoB
VSETIGTEKTANENRLKVLIIEDDRDLNNLLKFTLESTRDFEVDSIFDGAGALQQIETTAPNLIILDVMLPHVEGTEILRAIRRSPLHRSTPVILLTAKSQESDKIEGFEAGADDYITKPFSPKELILRVQALLRRTSSAANAPAPDRLNRATEFPETPATPSHSAADERVLVVGPISLYPDQFKVTLDGKTVPLTATEYQLLLYLAERPGRLQSRDALLQKVWGYEGQLNTRTVDTHIKRLRQKLGDAGSLIETVHGFGYQIITPDQR